MDVTVCIGTFAEASWKRLAIERAIPSALNQAPVVHCHRDTLTNARNAALDRVETDFAIFLDADDELEPGYVEAMAQGTADVRAPAVRYIKPNGRPARPELPKVLGHRHACSAECLTEGNWMVIGTCARTQLLRDVGGWRDFPWSEDWDMWLRCHLAGASIEPIPDAIYRAYMRMDSRNRAPTATFRKQAHIAIHRANGLPERDWAKL